MTTEMEPVIAWKLFSKGITPVEALDKVQIIWNKLLGQLALQMVSVMALSLAAIIVHKQRKISHRLV